MTHRINLQSAFVLHTRPYRDTSLLVELFTRSHGRISAIARGARGPRSRNKGYLQPFYPILASWSGRSELVTLGSIEPSGSPFHFMGKSLISALYVNELTMHLLHRHEEHPELFMAYEQVLSGIQQEKILSSLRRYEKQLITSIGYGFEWHITADTGEVIEPGMYYSLDPNRGILAVSAGSKAQTFLGEHLLAIQADDFNKPEVLHSAKHLLRIAINHLLGGKSINSRDLL